MYIYGKDIIVNEICLNLERESEIRKYGSVHQC